MLLHLLIKRQGESLSRTVIASEVWDIRNFDSDTNVVNMAIRHLRAKIDAPFDRKLIHTVRSIGYMFRINLEALASPFFDRTNIPIVRTDIVPGGIWAGNVLS